MVDDIAAPWTALKLTNSDQIEPILVVRTAVAQTPDLRDAPEDGSLAPANRLDRRAADQRSPGLDLHECHQAVVSYDEVEIVPAPSEAVCLDVVSTRGEVPQCGELTRKPTDVSGIFPCRGRYESTGLSHARD
jgi:hypothetical protein